VFRHRIVHASLDFIAVEGDKMSKKQIAASVDAPELANQLVGRLVWELEAKGQRCSKEVIELSRVIDRRALGGQLRERLRDALCRLSDTPS